MVLTTHSVVGGTLAQALSFGPAFSFVVGFLTHFILDAFPHWDYPLRSGRKSQDGNSLNSDIIIGKDFVIDLFKIFTDFVLGFAILFFIVGFPQSINELVTSKALWGAIGGVTPDFLQFVYFKFRREPLRTLQDVHVNVIHSKRSLNDKNIIGPGIQLALIIVVALLYLG